MTISAKSIAFARASRQQTKTYRIDLPGYRGSFNVEVRNGSIERAQYVMPPGGPGYAYHSVPADSHVWAKLQAAFDARDNGEEPERWDGLS